MTNNFIQVPSMEVVVAYPSASLTSNNGYVNLNEVDSSILEIMREFKLKEEFVLQKLQANVQSYSRKGYKGSDRTIWVGSYNGERIQRKSYEDIILSLYEQHAPNTAITVRELYEIFKNTRENDPNITSRTVESNEGLYSE